ncbi:hypothetical protein I79_019628 [Cricetulus griseus]|uniref:Uncharacterized protein n=1 Tax=Cricetulus griseus TaxID=10029 RepID=G3I7X8_CRIGR|nr:hypothetical protein I79_019628 [Cricetulus griseus]
MRVGIIFCFLVGFENLEYIWLSKNLLNNRIQKAVTVLGCLSGTRVFLRMP